MTFYSKKIYMSSKQFDRNPTYTVRCDRCKKGFQVIVSILTFANCPHCGAKHEIEFIIED